MVMLVFVALSNSILRVQIFIGLFIRVLTSTLAPTQNEAYSTAQVKEPIFFFISRTNFTIRDFPPSGLE